MSRKHKNIYIYIDECHRYLDESVTSLLETARKAKMGLTLAHQTIGQINDPKVSSALMSLTSTKFASQLSPEDATKMAKAMRTTPDYLHQPDLHFALYQKGDETVSVEVIPGVVEEMATHDVPDEEMIARYGRMTEDKPEEVDAFPSTVVDVSSEAEKKDKNTVDESGEW